MLMLTTLLMLTTAEPEVVDVAIVGGGPTGLATAIALSKAPALAGRSIVIFERDAFDPKGAIVGISEMAWAALGNIDTRLARQVRRKGSPVRAFVSEPLDAAAPQLERPNDTPPPNPVARALSVGYRWLRARLSKPAAITFRWHDVRMSLANRFKELRGADAVRGEHELVGMDAAAEGAEPGYVQLAFARRATPDAPRLLVRARLVIAADGVRSAARECSSHGPRAAALWIDEGKSIWRGIAPSLSLHAVSTYLVEPGGNGRIGMLFPAGRGKGSSWAVTAPAAAGRAADGDEARARLFAALPARPHAKLVAAINATQGGVIENKLLARNWSLPFGSGLARLAYAGDSAHPLRPTGQGLALAFEDAWTLGRLAADAPSADAFLTPATLRAYEQRRFERVRAVSLATGELAQLSYAAGDPSALAGMREPPPIEGYSPL